MSIAMADGSGDATFRLFAEAALLGHKLMPTRRQFELLKLEAPSFVRGVRAEIHDFRKMLASHAKVGEDAYCVEEIFDCGWRPIIHWMWLASAFEHFELWLADFSREHRHNQGMLPEEILLDEIFGDNIGFSIEPLEEEWAALLSEFGPVGVVLNYLGSMTELMKLNCDAEVMETAIFWQELLQTIEKDSSKCLRYTAVST